MNSLFDYDLIGTVGLVCRWVSIIICMCLGVVELEYELGLVLGFGVRFGKAFFAPECLVLLVLGTLF